MIILLLLKKPAWLLRSTTKAASQLKIGRNFDCQVAARGTCPKRARTLRWLPSAAGCYCVGG